MWDMVNDRVYENIGSCPVTEGGRDYVFIGNPSETRGWGMEGTAYP